MLVPLLSSRAGLPLVVLSNQLLPGSDVEMCSIADVDTVGGAGTAEYARNSGAHAM